MDFWEQYFTESLQSPWVIRAESSTSNEVWPERIFVVQRALNDAQAEMSAKMIAALKFKPEQVAILPMTVDSLDVFSKLSTTHKILFFGENFPGQSSPAQNWMGHQVLRTHDMKDLAGNNSLKKETWAHLQEFAKL